MPDEVEDILTGPADAAPVDTAAPVDAPADKPADAPADKPADAPADKPADAPADKPADAPAEDGVPEGEYVFELPEGIEVDADLAAAAQPVFKELGLTSGQANKLAGLIAEVRAKEADAIVESYIKAQNDYVAAAKADTEIGGTNWDKSVTAANQALQKFGTPALTAALREHGMQNHPEMIRALARIGSATADDIADTGASVDTKEVPAEERWYGSTTPTTKRG